MIRLKLRSKLALTLSVMVVPLAIGLAFLQVRLHDAAFEQGTAEMVVQRMEAGERWRCESRPGRWPEHMEPPDSAMGPRPGFRKARRLRHRRIRRQGGVPGWPGVGAVRVHAYGADFRSANPEAPVFDSALREALEAGDVFASRRLAGSRRQVAVRMPWEEGPCAVVVVSRQVDSTVRAVFLQTLVPVLSISLLAVLMAVFAAGTIVRRIRRLTKEIDSGGRDDVSVSGADEIAELGASFNERSARIREQIEELERRDEALRAYVSNTSHDVLLPVTVLQGHLSTMQRELAAGRPVDRSRVSDALEECHYLASLVHNLNAAAKLTAGRPHSERHPVNLNDVVERVIARHGPFARQREVNLDYSTPEIAAVVLGDVTLIEQAFGNVVHNAVRYNRVGGHVAVVLEHGSGRFSLRVSDDGPGLTEEEIGMVVERGFRGSEARTRHPHGMGLGLAITKEVVEHHGWQLDLKRRSEGGLEVELTGPLSETEAA